MQIRGNDLHTGGTQSFLPSCCQPQSSSLPVPLISRELVLINGFKEHFIYSSQRVKAAVFAKLKTKQFEEVRYSSRQIFCFSLSMLPFFGCNNENWFHFAMRFLSVILRAEDILIAHGEQSLRKRKQCFGSCKPCAI